MGSPSIAVALRKQERSYLKKRTKKLLCPAAYLYPAMSRFSPRLPEAKVFWFFSSEKNILVFKNKKPSRHVKNRSPQALDTRA
jgi:hypothetical protein